MLSTLSVDNNVRNFVISALTANGVYGFIVPPTLYAIIIHNKNNTLPENAKAAKNYLAAFRSGAGLVYNPAQYWTFLVVLLAELMHGLYQRRRVLRVGKLRNAVPQIEHMAAAVTIAGQNFLGLVADRVRRRE